MPLMKVVKTVLSFWMCLIFLSSGLSGLTICITPDGHICLKLAGSNTPSEPCSQSHEVCQDRDDQGMSHPTAERCCYKCVDMPLPGAKIPECTVQQPEVTKISKVRLATCLNVALLSYSHLSATSAFGYSRNLQGAATRSDRTVVLRI